MPTVLQKPTAFFQNFDRKPSQQQSTHYCPGCGHGILNKLIAETISDLGIKDQTIFVGPVGCGVFYYYYFDVASVSAPHGRASAVGTGVSRAHPEGITLVYQGDGDLAAIGTSNALHAANRGENMIVFFVNNNIYGMTGGQLAPTTLIGQKTTTSPYGRSLQNDGPPLHMTELIATLEAPVLVARVAVNSPKNIMQARKVIRRGMQAQKDHKGYVFIEVLSQCPTNWRKTPIDACRWIEETVTKCFPLGIKKDVIDERDALTRPLGHPDFQTIAHAIGLDKNEETTDKPCALPFPEIRLKSAGFGGQGVLSLGLIFAFACMKKGLQTTWLPSYGPEMRGGVANCSVMVSKTKIGTPVVDAPNVLVAMNKPSMFRFAPLVPEDGIIIYNSTMIDEIPENIQTKNLFALDAGNIAMELGNSKFANSVVLAYLAAKTKMFDLPELKEYVRGYFANDKIYEANIPALERGFALGRREIDN
ncbi:MAG: 2-oxoacid:acceptor oxidoreductase family protein [Planctomycetia bacterium]|nr:2-oxoacid:acceptor oxidoreductase family protein [Planctomycetia bacterium]